jgi:hypothetical protein
MEDFDQLGHFKVACPCGESSLFVLGYKAKSAVDPTEEIFIGPLAIQCSACGKVSELMDPAKDGHDGEHGNNVTMRGKGRRVRFACPECGPAALKVFPGFSYQFEAEEFEPEEREHIQDFFDSFWLDGECSKCGKFQSITGFECA